MSHPSPAKRIILEVRMSRRILPTIAILCYAGCGNQPGAQPAQHSRVSNARQAEIKIGSELGAIPCLPFKITKVYENRTPAAQAPFHVNGGEWPFFDCEVESNKNVQFTVGTAAKKTGDNLISAWGRAV